MVVLVYHDIVSPENRDSVGFPGPVAARYKLTPQAFDDHLDAIAAAGVEVGRIVAGTPLPKVALTFDDGGGTALATADALERRGWCGHFFVTTCRIGSPGFVTARDVAELAARGHCVGSHSHTHPGYMGRMPSGELELEWSTSRDVLSTITGASPDLASVPGGFLSPAVVQAAAAAGYRTLLTSEPETRVRSYGDIAVVGRYAIWASTPARVAMAYARGDRSAHWRLWTMWKAKTLAKRAAPGVYELGRRVRAGGRRSREPTPGR